MEKPLPERIKALADPSLRSLLVAEAERPVSRSGPLAPKNPTMLFLALTMDAGQPTYVPSHWVRDTGLLPRETAARKLTAEGAKLFGIPDRGVLTPGAFADVNVIDLAAPAAIDAGADRGPPRPRRQSKWYSPRPSWTTR
jgi:amidohydrolase family protein